MEARVDVKHDEIEKKVLEESLPEKRVRHPHTVKHVEKKLVEKGVLRMDRHPADGKGGLNHAPKSGHGGKYTWEGPDDEAENELNPAPPAVDPKDPNYVEDEVDAEVEQELVVGEVEVAKVAEAKEGVSRIDVILPSNEQAV